LARTYFDIDSQELFPNADDYDIIAIGLQEAPMMDQTKITTKMIDYLKEKGFRHMVT
jgi:hypothetical protein